MSSAKQPTKSFTSGLDHVQDWFTKNHWETFTFQEECWESVLNGKEGILHAPTGSGKTLALWMPHIIRWLDAKKQAKKAYNSFGLPLCEHLLKIPNDSLIRV